MWDEGEGYRGNATTPQEHAGGRVGRGESPRKRPEGVSLAHGGLDPGTHVILWSFHFVDKSHNPGCRAASGSSSTPESLAEPLQSPLAPLCPLPPKVLASPLAVASMV